MATWEELEPEQRDVYSTWERELRALAGEMYRLTDKLVAIDTMYSGQIAAILVALNDNTVVPNTSGLAGSQSLDSDAEAVTIQSHFQAYLAAFNSSGHRQLWTKAAGLPNTIGG
jgi:hypothetical protein